MRTIRGEIGALSISYVIKKEKLILFIVYLSILTKYSLSQS